jgi:hypothetical protein
MAFYDLPEADLSRKHPPSAEKTRIFLSFFSYFRFFVLSGLVFIGPASPG